MQANIDILVKELCKLPRETGWVEFKHNNCEPMMVGEDISALANTATLKDRDFAYMVWGVEDGTHNIVGTTVRLPMQKKVARIPFFIRASSTRALFGFLGPSSNVSATVL